MAITKTWEVNTLERELADEVARVEKWLEDEIALINTPVTAEGKPW